MTIEWSVEKNLFRLCFNKRQFNRSWFVNKTTTGKLKKIGRERKLKKTIEMDYFELNFSCLFCIIYKYCYWFLYYFDCIGGRHFLTVDKRFSFHLSHFWPFNLYCCGLWLVIPVGDVTIYRQFSMVHLINLYRGPKSLIYSSTNWTITFVFGFCF